MLNYYLIPYFQYHSCVYKANERRQKKNSQYSLFKRLLSGNVKEFEMAFDQNDIKRFSHKYVLVTFLCIGPNLSNSFSPTFYEYIFLLKTCNPVQTFLLSQSQRTFLQVSKAIPVAIQVFVRNYDIASNMYSHIEQLHAY